jgi:hypothetical protein
MEPPPPPPCCCCCATATAAQNLLSHNSASLSSSTDSPPPLPPPTHLPTNPTMSSGERVHNRNPPPLGYQHLTDGHLFDEPTAPPPPLKELPYPYGLGDGDGGVQGSVFVAKQWEGLLVPTKLQLLCNHKGESVVVKVHEGVLQENVARLKSIYCNHPGWCIVGVRACIVEKCTAPPRLSGSHEHVTVCVVQEYMDLHSFKDILLPPPLPQRPPAVPEAACAWAAKCVRGVLPSAALLTACLLHNVVSPGFARPAVHRQL